MAGGASVAAECQVTFDRCSVSWVECFLNTFLHATLLRTSTATAAQRKFERAALGVSLNVVAVRDDRACLRLLALVWTVAKVVGMWLVAVTRSTLQDTFVKPGSQR